MKKIFLTLCVLQFVLSMGQYRPVAVTKEQVEKAKNYARDTYASLSPEDRLGQLYIVALYTNRGEEHINKVRELVEQEKVGGIILMQDDAERALRLVNEFQQKSSVPILFGMDAEWGLFQRLKEAHKFPWAMTLGAVKDIQLIYEMAAMIAEDCQKMGIRWNFAPVVDVNTNPQNPIIGNRSFGSEVTEVTRRALMYAQGLQQNGVLASIKHFPGHGDTDRDSHLDLPAVTHQRKRLDEVELAPFRALMQNNIGGVMVAHLYVPDLEPQKNLPASLSKAIVTDLLKDTYHYEGLIITDALNMNAVASRYSPGELDLKALQAGNDILLFSQDVPNGKKKILDALKTGQLKPEQIEKSVQKILEIKYLLGLTEFKPLPVDSIREQLNTPRHHDMSRRIYANALTLIQNHKNTLPFTPKQKIYYLPLEEGAYDGFEKELKNIGNIQTISPKDALNLPKDTQILIALHKDNTTPYKPYKISNETQKIIKKLKKDKGITLSLFGSPYGLMDIDLTKIDAVILAYENNLPAWQATAKGLYSGQMPGKLPVKINTPLEPNNQTNER